MARTVDKVQLRLELVGFSAIKSIGKDFDKFTNTVKFTPKQLDKLLERLKKVNKTTQLSKNSFEGQIGVLTKLRNAVGIGTEAYDRLGKEIDQVRASMDALSGSAKKQGVLGKLGAGFKAGRGAALTGAVGRFLPPSAQIGGAAGFVKGGVPGAIAGGAIGLGVDAVAGGVQFARQAAIQASQVQKLEIALKGVTSTQADFEKGLKIIADTSKRLNVPIAASTKQFTTLSASVLGAGGTIEDAQVVFEGVSNAIKATGGNAEDVQSAIRAMSQIFGKGKVSAEELQGQLGERLAGAVVKFAEANGSSLQKLQKDLRDGTVGLDQVIKFAQKLNIDFAETAEKVANSSADAGQRLQTQFNNFSIAIGKSIIPIGAAFQQLFSDILIGLQENKEGMDLFIGSIKLLGGFAFATIASIRFLVRVLADLAKILFHISQLEFGKAFETAQKGIKDTFENAKKDFQALADMQALALFGTSSPLNPDIKTEGLTSKDKEDISKEDQLIAFLNRPKGKGLPKLTTDDKTKNKFNDEILKLQRGIALKKIEDDTERKILERKFKFIDAVKKAKEEEDEGNQIKLITLATQDFIIDRQNIINDELEKGKAKAFNFAEEFKKISSAATDLKSRVGELALDTTVKLADAFADFFFEGKKGFADLAKSALKELNRIIIRAAFMKTIANPILGKLNLLPNADGNVIANNKIVPYAKGGLIKRPTLFPLADGAALAGEAGVEAIMPLRRGRNGKLGVEASGGNIGNITVNVDASGSSVEGDNNQSQELGNILGAAIQAELIRQKRPGGLLG